jgi:ubiquinone/menaquinone biosynthesis C-methylase UbiE
MATDYDPIAEQYQRSKLTPWRAHLECYSLLDALGDVNGQRILDVACGEGFYTRLLSRRGAKLTGVDLSAGMVDLARQQEAAAPLGIEYLVGDGRDLPFDEEFDLVIAAYLLNYAPTPEELAAMCQGVAGSLKPGGRFVTVNSNPACDFRATPSYRSYGFEARGVDPWQPGAPITWTFFLSDGEFSIENYFLTVEQHDQALRAAGFREVLWRPLQISPEGLAAHGGEFWETFLKTPPVTLIECVK